jgi:hypothetical protein
MLTESAGLTAVTERARQAEAEADRLRSEQERSAAVGELARLRARAVLSLLNIAYPRAPEEPSTYVQIAKLREIGLRLQKAEELPF